MLFIATYIMIELVYQSDKNWKWVLQNKMLESEY